MAYPTLPIDNRSTMKPVNMVATNLTGSGGVRQRNFASVELFEFDMNHSMITKAEADSVYADWQANKTAEVTMTWVDGAVYVVRYKEPPIRTHEVGQWWKAQSKLVGYAQ